MADMSGLMGGLGGFIQGFQGGQQYRDQWAMDQARMDLERLRVQAAIDEARERLSMDRDRHQQEMDMAREMKLRRSQSPYQLLQPQLSPLGPGGQGPLLPEVQQEQANAQQLMEQMGPLGTVPLQDQDIFQTLRGYQQEADQAARMQQPLPEYYGEVYPGMPSGATYQDFSSLQPGLASTRDVFKAAVDSEGGGDSAWKPANAVSLLRTWNDVRSDAMTQGLPAILNDYPEVRAMVASAQEKSLGPLSQSDLMMLLPREALQDLNDYATLQANNFLNHALETGGMGADPYLRGGGEMPDFPLSPGVEEPADERQQINEVIRQNLMDFQMENPATMNLPLYNTPAAEDYIGNYWYPGMDMQTLIEELRARAEAAGAEPGVVPIERQRSEKKSPRRKQGAGLPEMQR